MVALLEAPRGSSKLSPKLGDKDHDQDEWTDVKEEAATESSDESSYEDEIKTSSSSSDGEGVKPAPHPAFVKVQKASRGGGKSSSSNASLLRLYQDALVQIHADWQTQQTQHAQAMAALQSQLHAQIVQTERWELRHAALSPCDTGTCSIEEEFWQCVASQPRPVKKLRRKIIKTSRSKSPPPPKKSRKSSSSTKQSRRLRPRGDLWTEDDHPHVIQDVKEQVKSESEEKEVKTPEEKQPVEEEETKPDDKNLVVDEPAAFPALMPPMVAAPNSPTAPRQAAFLAVIRQRDNAEAKIAALKAELETFKTTKTCQPPLPLPPRNANAITSDDDDDDDEGDAPKKPVFAKKRVVQKATASLTKTPEQNRSKLLHQKVIAHTRLPEIQEEASGKSTPEQPEKSIEEKKAPEQKQSKSQRSKRSVSMESRMKKPTGKPKPNPPGTKLNDESRLSRYAMHRFRSGPRKQDDDEDDDDDDNHSIQSTQSAAAARVGGTRTSSQHRRRSTMVADDDDGSVRSTRSTHSARVGPRSSLPITRTTSQQRRTVVNNNNNKKEDDDDDDNRSVRSRRSTQSARGSTTTRTLVRRKKKDLSSRLASLEGVAKYKNNSDDDDDRSLHSTHSSHSVQSHHSVQSLGPSWVQSAQLMAARKKSRRPHRRLSYVDPHVSSNRLDI